MDVKSKINELFDSPDERSSYGWYCDKAKITDFALSQSDAKLYLQNAGWLDANLNKFIQLFGGSGTIPTDFLPLLGILRLPKST